MSPELLKYIMEYGKEDVEQKEISTKKEIYFNDNNGGKLAKVYVTVVNK